MKSNHHIAGFLSRITSKTPLSLRAVVRYSLPCFLLCLTSVAFAQSAEHSPTKGDGVSKHPEPAKTTNPRPPEKSTDTPVKKSESRLRTLFAQIKPGMSRAAVENLLGPPLLTTDNQIVYIKESERTKPIVGSPWGYGAIHVRYDKDKKVADKQLNPQYVDPIEPVANSIYVKVFLPLKPLANDKLLVESWVLDQLKKQNVEHARAVTGWVKLPAYEDIDSIDVWNATTDGKGWGCPVHGTLSKLRPDGKVNVELNGWLPFQPTITGNLILAETGNRRLAVVNGATRRAFFAILVGPPVR